MSHPPGPDGTRARCICKELYRASPHTSKKRHCFCILTRSTSGRKKKTFRQLQHRQQQDFLLRKYYLTNYGLLHGCRSAVYCITINGRQNRSYSLATRECGPPFKWSCKHANQQRSTSSHIPTLWSTPRMVSKIGVLDQACGRGRFGSASIATGTCWRPEQKPCRNEFELGLSEFESLSTQQVCSCVLLVVYFFHLSDHSLFVCVCVWRRRERFEAP